MENISVNQETPARRAAVAGLAVVGFFALVFIGMVLAVYAARFVPKTASGLSAAAAYLTSAFTPNGTPATLSVVSTSTIPFDDATSTATTTALVATTTDSKPATHVAPSAGAQTTDVQPIGGSGSATSGTVSGYTGPLTGLPNLDVTITAIGYLDSNGNVVPETTIYNNQPLAIQFTISNSGTNVTGPWDFKASLPTKLNGAYTYYSVAQQSLNPGDHISYTLHLDAGEAQISNNATVTIVADPNNNVAETNENNTVTDSIIVSSSNI